MKRRKFIRLTGVSGVAFTGLLPLLSCSRETDGIEDELKQMAMLAFQRFEEVWDFLDFWKRGNTFDACLVFANAVQQRWPDDPEVNQMNEKIGSMLEQNLAFYNSINFGEMWADDFGWWGLLAINARKFLLRQGNLDLADQYWDLSTTCWEHKRNTAFDHSKTALPIPHGCRNGDANGNSLGVKNTVTNVLLFLLSSRIYRLAKAENRDDTDKYLEMTYAQWLWFNEWFKLEEFEFLKNLESSGALVQERPLAMFEGSAYTEKVHPPWAEGWVWTGDQGMLVAALCDMISMKDDLAKYISENGLDPEFNEDSFQENASEIIQQIGEGVSNALVADVDQIIREAPCLSSFGPAHGRDYVAGRGIMMRYLGSSEERTKLGVDLNESVLNTVQAIWDSRDTSNNQFQPEFTTADNDKLYVEQFRSLWSIADEVHKWDLETMKEVNKNGVCQAVGLDMIGAAIKTLTN